jgi:hypothetical protein
MTDKDVGPLAEFDEAVASVTQRRGASYGHPADDFARVAKIAEVVRECDDPLIQHVLYMIAVKMCRIVETPDHLDSWIDIAGYARTAAMVMDRRAEEGPAPEGEALSTCLECETPRACHTQGCQYWRNR